MRVSSGGDRTGRSVHGGVCVFVALALAIGAGGVGAVAGAGQLGAPRVAATSRGGKGSKLSPRLAALATGTSLAAGAGARAAQAAALSLPSTGTGSLVRRPDGTLVVQIRTSDVSPPAVARLRSLGARIVNVSAGYSTVTADVLPASLRSIAAIASVQYVSEVLAPRLAAVGTPSSGGAVTASSAQCGSTTSQGDGLMNVATARSAHNVDGAGQTIGILSDSYNTDSSAVTHAANDVATGDLPGIGNPCGYTSPVVVQSDYSAGGQGDEGRALAQLAHDLAPGAHLAFATGNNGDLDFAAQITKLRSVNHASVIVDDIGYANEPFFQDGPIATAANQAASAGVTYISAAGNSNVVVGGHDVSSYETPAFRSVACPASIGAVEPVMGCHDFDTTAGTDNGDAITLAPGGGFALDMQWAEPWGSVSSDYDLFVIDSTGAVVADSAIDNLALQEPFELLGYSNTTSAAQTVRVVIAKFAGSTNDRLKFVTIGSAGITAVEHNTSVGGDIVGPSIFGHGGAAGVGSTAAIPSTDSTTSEEFSSHGPVTLYFAPTPSVTPLATPQVLDKPTFAATDDVETTFFGPVIGSVRHFAGTSAAAPQAAAIAALLAQYDPALTAAQILATMRSTARAVATNGGPSDVGGGYLDAAAALASVVPLPAPPRSVTASPGNAQATVHWSAPATNPNFPINGYVVTPFRAGVAQAATTFNSTATTQTVTGLTNAASYTFTVKARNANGVAHSSIASPAIIVGTPAAPVTVSARPGNAQATVHWSAPATNNGAAVTGYVVNAYVGFTPAATHTYASTATTETMTGLTNGTTYRFTVAAINARGTGPASTVTGPVIVGTPSAPPAPTATAGVKQATLHWAAPTFNNGGTITGYVVTPYLAGVAQAAITYHTNATTQTVTGLQSAKSYTFTVAATNSRGTGPASSPSNAVTPT